jgi:hypothetical protein
VKPDDRYSSIPEHQQALLIERKTVKASLQFLEQKYGEERGENEHLENLFRRLQIDLKSLDQEFEESNGTGEDSSKKYRSIYLELLEHQRQVLTEMNRSANVNEELVRKYLSLIDLEEYKIQERQLSVVDAANVGPVRPGRSYIWNNSGESTTSDIRPESTPTISDSAFCVPLSGDWCLRNLKYGKYLLPGDVP